MIPSHFRLTLRIALQLFASMLIMAEPDLPTYTFTHHPETYGAALNSLFIGRPEDTERDLSKIIGPNFYMVADSSRFYHSIGTDVDVVTYFHRIVVEKSAVSLVRRSAGSNE